MSEMTQAQIDSISIETESEESELTLKDIVAEIAKETFGTDEMVSAYKVAVIVNKVFQATMTDKQIPTQMTYNYTRNGMIAKGKKGKAAEIRYTKAEVEAFVFKYTNKHVEM